MTQDLDEYVEELGCRLGRTERERDMAEDSLLRAQKVLRSMLRQTELHIDGASVSEVARLLGVTRPTVYSYRRTILRLSRKGISGRPRRG